MIVRAVHNDYKADMLVHRDAGVTLTGETKVLRPNASGFRRDPPEWRPYTNQPLFIPYSAIKEVSGA